MLFVQIPGAITTYIAMVHNVKRNLNFSNNSTLQVDYITNLLSLLTAIVIIAYLQIYNELLRYKKQMTQNKQLTICQAIIDKQSNGIFVL